MAYFSIIIPAFNRGFLIDSLINQLLQQTFKDFEIIVVDDGSTDDTRSILIKYQNSEKILCHYQKNKGVCAARNEGANLANGKYLIFLDTDDNISINWLADFFSVLHYQKGGYIAFCSVKVVTTNGEYVLKASPQATTENLLKLFKAGSFAIRNDFFHTVGGYDPEIKFGENTEFGIRVLGSDVKMLYVSAPNFIYTPSSNGGSKNLENLAQGNEYVLRKHASFFSQNWMLRKSYQQTIAVASYKLRSRNKARHFFLRAWLSNPTDLKAISRLVLSNIRFLADRIWQVGHIGN